MAQERCQAVPVYDELDLAIVDAVRTAPRASWRDLAPVLGVDAATVSRRWSRMQADGVAWVTAHLGGRMTPSVATVEISCFPQHSTEVAAALAEDAEAATVKLTAGARDLMVLAQAPDLEALADYLLDRVSHVAGVRDVRSHIVTHSAVDASKWREGALDLDQRRQLHSPPPTGTGRRTALDPTDNRIVRALSLDGRASFEQLATHAGIGPVAVRRRLARLEDAGLVTYRCDISQHLSGRTVHTVFFCSIGVNKLAEAEQRIRELHGVRSCNVVSGPCNLVVDASLRSISEAHDLEREMSQALPALRVHDRAVVLRMIKLLGRVLDADGKSVRSVPLLAEAAG